MFGSLAYPWPPPRATVHYAPDRDYDLLHVALGLEIDPGRRAFRGAAVNTLAPLHAGLRTIRLDCGANLDVKDCSVAGRAARFTHQGDTLQVVAPGPLAPGKPVAVRVRFASGRESDGYRWIRPTVPSAHHVGFYTRGQTESPRDWLPTWGYPNDFATSEMRVTVPADWYVVSNGALRSSLLSKDRTTRTFHWKMDQPHATYLNSLCAGPFDIKKASWRGVSLMYVVPRGKGDRIEDTFGATPDMLSFFSDLLGVKYPWSQYAQTAVYDGEGMEYVSATTFGDSVLIGALDGPSRAGYRGSDNTVSHELSHQWFGDLVTCGDWGDSWLNEGFAVLFTALYRGHSRSQAVYDQYIEVAMQGYFEESRRYRRPLATRLYEDPGAMFDAHAYPKGGAVLHTLRRYLGDRAFFAGLRHYLNRHRHQPVDSHDFCRALTEATGVNLEPFFDQWVFKPGHPVLDYTWTWDQERRQVVVTIRQTQDTRDGTPLYDLDAAIGLIGDRRLTRRTVRLNQAVQEVRLPAAHRPDAVLLDPDHDFLREIPLLHWSDGELEAILRYAPNAVDRQEAMRRLLAGAPTDSVLAAVTEVLRADRGRFPALTSLARLGELQRESLRPLFRSELAHPNSDRRWQAILALGKLPSTPSDRQALRALADGPQPSWVLRGAVTVLSRWDAGGNADIFERVARIGQDHELLRLACASARASAAIAQGKPAPDPDPAMREQLRGFLSDYASGVKTSPRMSPRMRARTPEGGDAALQRGLDNQTRFVFLARDDAPGLEIEPGGETARSIWYFELTMGQEQRAFKFFVGADGKVMAFRSFPL